MTAPPADHPLAVRHRVLRALRTFFDARGFTEVQTPVRILAPALEPHIYAVPSGAAWLRTSPELHMKRLLAAGWPAIYQIGPCFRAGERGTLHHPEFTMLEWYRAEADAERILADVGELLPLLAGLATPAARHRRPDAIAALDKPVRRITVAEAFRQTAGWDPLHETDMDRFDRDLVDRVEPSLPRDAPVVLTGYPPAAAGFARVRPGPPAVAERWELYVGGIELVNAATELTDPVEYRRRYDVRAALRAARGESVYPPDEAFLAAAGALPPCAGAAMGVDRLVMLLAGCETVWETLATPEEIRDPPSLRWE
ncbi:MAG: EF-P lysine aminoacylase GenX [Kiritimatiellae bacterium]|nr:EF-P lysine aminoacylase GenX [Kiritimatiellia bacterium]